VRRILKRLREARLAFAGVLHNPGLRRLELAWAFSIVGSWAYSVAVVVFAYEHGGAAAVGVVGLLRWVAAGIASPFAAVLGDRYDRRVVMVSSDLARAGLIGVAAAAVYVGASPVLVYVLATLVSVAGTPFRPAEAAYTPVLARTPEELSAANVVAAAIESIGIFAGPALGGLLLVATGTATVFLATAAALVASALLILRISGPASVTSPARPAESVLDELLAGARAIASDRRVALLVGLFAAQTFVDGLLGVLIAVLALSFLDAGAAAVGWLNAASGVGGVLGAVLAAALVGRGRLAADFGVGVLLFGIPLALLPAWRSETFALLLLAVVGIGNTLADVSGFTLLQRSAPDAVLARVFGVLESLLLLTVGLGAIVAPVLMSTLGTRGALIVAGLLLPALVLPAWPVLRAIDREAPVPVALERLRAIPIFTPLPEATLEQLARALVQVTVAANEEVVRQGERGDRFYVVDSGTFDVLVDGASAGTLETGDHFGEIALLREVPRTATVRARGDAVLFALERHDFVPAVAGYAPSLASANAVIGMRLGPARAGTVRA